MKKSYDNPRECIKKQRHHFANKGMVFPVVKYRYESCTIKKGEHQRIDAFELWCRRILFTVPWTARRSNQSILKDINLYTDWKKTLLLGRNEGKRRKGKQKMR